MCTVRRRVLFIAYIAIWSNFLAFSASAQGQRTTKSQLSSAFKAVAKKCLIPGKNRPLLEAISLSDFTLTPLIVDSSAFDVNISHVTVKNLNRYSVTDIEKVSSSDDEKPASDKVSWYRISVKIPLLALSGKFFARGFVAQLFPVEGAGRIYAYYKQVSVVVKLAIVEPEGNGTALILSEGENLVAEDVTFEEVALSVTQGKDEDIESLDGGGGDRESKSFQVGSVLFWKTARETGRELSIMLPTCLQARLKEALTTSSEQRSKKRNRRRL